MVKTCFPLLGMNYILNDTAQIIDFRMNEVEKVNILLCAQPNSYPHLGTLLNFMLAFGYAKNVGEKFGVDVEVTLDLLEHGKGKKLVIGDSTYFKSLSNTYSKSKEKNDYIYYREYFETLLDEISDLSGVEYKIRTYREFQKDYFARKALINMYNHYDPIAQLICPNEGKLRTRIACPKCGLYSTNTKDTLVKIKEDKLLLYSKCPYHGEYSLEFTTDNDAEVNTNVPMRNLMRGVSIIENDKISHSLSVIFEGADWGGIWPLRVYVEGLKVLGYNQIPTLIYTPQVLDRTGAKLSKRMYVGGDEAYRNMCDEYIVNISLIKEALGENAISAIWPIFLRWSSDPKCFFREYTVDYLNSVILEAIDEKNYCKF